MCFSVQTSSFPLVHLSQRINIFLSAVIAVGSASASVKIKAAREEVLPSKQQEFYCITTEKMLSPSREFDCSLFSLSMLANT